MKDEITKENKDDQVAFTNIDDEEFIGMWGGIQFPIKAGETKGFHRYEAYTFAKHLIDKIALKKDPEGFKLGDGAYRQELEDRILGGASAPEPEKPKTEEDVIKEEAEKVQKEIKAKEEAIKAKKQENIKKAQAALKAKRDAAKSKKK